jgi:hypothetical protein
MTPLAYVVLLLVVGLPIAWFASEFKAKRALRIGLGVAALLTSFGVAFIVGALNRLNYNAWYGGATANLLDATIAGIESGDTGGVLEELKRLRSEYRPTYENRAGYDVLVRAAVDRIESVRPRTDGPEGQRR